MPQALGVQNHFLAVWAVPNGFIGHKAALVVHPQAALPDLLGRARLRVVRRPGVQIRPCWPEAIYPCRIGFPHQGQPRETASWAASSAACCAFRSWLQAFSLSRGFSMGSRDSRSDLARRLAGSMSQGSSPLFQNAIGHPPLFKTLKTMHPRKRSGHSGRPCPPTGPQGPLPAASGLPRNTGQKPRAPDAPPARRRLPSRTPPAPGQRPPGYTRPYATPHG